MSGLVSRWLKDSIDWLWIRHKSPAPRRSLREEKRSGEVLRAVHVEATIEWAGTDDELVRQRVTIENESVSGYGIRLPESLPAGLTVWVNFPDNPGTKTVVRHCRPDGDSFVAGLIQVKSERRRADRVPARSEAELTWESGGTRARSSVLVLDSSPDGVQIEVAEAVPEDTIAELSFGPWKRFGIICYCVRKVEKFLVGIHFTGPAHHKDAIEYRN